MMIARFICEVPSVFRLKFLLPLHAMQLSKYRNRVSIMSDILASIKFSKKGLKKTQIMQSANLNYLQTKKYLSYMLNCGFLVVTERETYAITPKGTCFLQATLVEKTHIIR